jgi:putative ABC transport system substrate-binding protein
MAGVDPGLPLSRRQVVQGVGSAGLALLAACGRLPFQAPLHQPAKQPRLGILWPGLAPIGPAPELDAFRDGLRERGWLEGQNLTVEYRFAERGEGEALSLAVELVRLGMDVIAAPGTPAVRAAKNATSVIPIVMMSSSDAIADGFVAGLARPGGNVTGLTQMLSQLGAKRLELLKEVVPAISRVAILWRNPDTGLSLRELQVVARALELQLQSVDVEGLDELERAFDAAAPHPRRRAGGGAAVAGDVRVAGLRGRWGVDRLRAEPARHVAPCCHIRGQDPARRTAREPASRAAYEIRLRD